MNVRIVEFAHNVSDPKVAVSVATSATASGVGLWAGWIPDDIGKIAALLGAILSLVVIVTTVATFRCTRRRLELECYKLAQEIEERRVISEARKAAGLQVCRADDF